MPLAAFGAIHLDTIAHADRRILRETSTPAALAVRPGGVATNVARALARLDCRIALAGRLGHEAEADGLLVQLTAEGVETGAIRRSDLPSGRYLALHDPDGTLAAAVVDARITETLEPGALLPLTEAQAAAGCWFLDANLPQPLLVELAEATGERRLTADAVSRAKAARLAPILPRLDLLFCNRVEAAALLGRDEDPDGEQQEDGGAEAANALVEAGVKAVVMTRGAAPVLLATHAGIDEISLTARDGAAAPPPRIVDVTGAGDALIAGTLAGLEHGLPLAQAVAAGMRAAALTLECAGAVAEALDWPAIAPTN
ncbi:PfkB family carbohydrate kinase [Stappia indica]|uniref:Pseudouridine kinase n=1 Tax=Stappia indica TaxID=538381 RepID=A0A285R5T5_9HYPH|nr:PfkB family carbohydrate kinase [Stappia indica]SOB89138.1 pseudouridine kinase [Stappia indica]